MLEDHSKKTFAFERAVECEEFAWFLNLRIRLLERLERMIGLKWMCFALEELHKDRGQEYNK